MPFANRGRLLARLAALLLLGSAVAGCHTTKAVYRGQSCEPCPPCEPLRPVAQQDAPPQGIVPVSATEAVPSVITAPPANSPYATGPMPAPRSMAPPQAGPRSSSNYRLFPTPPHSKGLLGNLFSKQPTAQEPPRLGPTPSQVPCQGPGCTSAVMLRPVPSEGGFVPAHRVPASEPVPAAYVPVTRPTDGPSLDVSLAAPPPRKTEQLGQPKEESAKDKDKEKDKEKGKGSSMRTLPNPRPVPKMPEGYPTLPNPTVTQPPAAPREFEKRAYSRYIIEPPDVLQIDLASFEGAGDKNFPIRGTHLVGQDGYIQLGPLGSVFVAGLTIDEAKFRIVDRIVKARAEESKYYQVFRDTFEAIKVDVAAYNSKYYYVIADGGGYGEQVYRVLCTGNETVLDAIAQIEGLPRVASKSKIWVARATPREIHNPHILPVDWVAITKLGAAATNYQIYPGDRIYVDSDPLIRADSALAKIISPIERLFGITLLGSTTINSIKGNQGGNNNVR